MTESDVLILGAGPVGLTLANELARRDVKPRIVDRAPSIREVSKALILHVRTQEVFGKLGVMGAIKAEAQPLTEVVVHAYGKHIGSWDLDGIDSPFPHPLIIGQNRTQHNLVDLLASRGVTVDWNTEATALTLDGNGATVTLARGAGPMETARCAYLVGAEGSNSLVRRTLNISFEGERYSGEQFIQADCRIAWALPTGRSYLFLTADGYMMVIELPHGLVRIFISLPDQNQWAAAATAQQVGAVEATSEQPTLQEIKHHFVRLSGFDCDLQDPGWLARYRTSHRYAGRFSEGRAFIAGDAAHVHVPIGGQGMNTGIQDAFNLGWKLAGVIKGQLSGSVLESYNSERQPVAASLIKGTDFAYRGVLHPSELRQRAARAVGPFLVRSRRVQDFMRDTLEELSIFYPESPLNFDFGGSRGPKAGERVLDAELVQAGDLSTTTLSALTSHDRWTILLFSGESPDATIERELATIASNAETRFGNLCAIHSVLAGAATSVATTDRTNLLYDTLQIVHDRYGVSSAAIYVFRPDTYIAGRGPLHSWEKIASALARIFKGSRNGPMGST